MVSRDAKLLDFRFTVGGVEYQLKRGTLDPNWWRVVSTVSGKVGGLLTYVDDFLLGGS